MPEFRTRKRGTKRQVGKKFPVEGKKGVYKQPQMKVSKVELSKREKDELCTDASYMVHDRYMSEKKAFSELKAKYPYASEEDIRKALKWARFHEKEYYELTDEEYRNVLEAEGRKHGQLRAEK